MTFRIEHDSTRHIIECVLSGSVTAEEMREAASKAIALSQEHGVTRFLVDGSAQEETASLFDIYDLPAQASEDGLDARSRIAYVIPVSPQLKDDARFFEDVLKNRG
jgi:hypothetical protein